MHTYSMHTCTLYVYSYYDVISAESPEVNAKIERRVDLCHHTFFLARYEAQKVHLCSDEY